MRNFEFSETIERPKYKVLGDFHEGMAKVTGHNNKVGFIDKYGNEIIPPIYLDAKDFSNGVAAVKDGEDSWTYIDREGKILFDKRFKEAESFSEGFAAVKVLKDSAWCWTYINKKGKQIKEVKNNYRKLYPFKEGYGLAFDGYEYDIIDKTGKVRHYRYATNFSNGRALVKQGQFFNEYQIIDTNLEVKETVTENISFASPTASSGLVRVKYPGGKQYFGPITATNYAYTYLNLLTGQLLPSIFYEAGDFINGYARVAPQRNQVGFIDTDGKALVFWRNVELSDDFSDDVVSFQNITSGLYGFLDCDGKEIIPSIYKSVGKCSDGLISATDRDGFNRYMRKDSSIYMKFPKEYVTSINTGDEIITISASSEEELAEKKIKTLELIKERIVSRIDSEKSDIESEVYEMEDKTI